MGGDLNVDTLLMAYHFGIFPWYEEGQPIMWYAPNPRSVLFPDRLHVSTSMRKFLKKKLFSVTADHSFEEVITACQTVKRGGRSGGTWITPEMKEAYTRLHYMGYAHSVEVWDEKKLIGGIYGISLGKIFFGESMFSLKSNASKTALICLVTALKKREYRLIDCQQDTAHMRSLGAENISREDFLDYLGENRYLPEGRGLWKDWVF